MGKDQKVQPFIDFGIGINQYKTVKKLILLFPFSFSEQELLDLYDYVKNPQIARLIFNETECEVSSRDKYMVIESANFNRLFTFEKQGNLYGVGNIINSVQMLRKLLLEQESSIISFMMFLKVSLPKQDRIFHNEV